MNKKSITAALIMIFFCLPVLADQASDQDYINKLYYQHNKLTVLVKTRIVNVNRNYSSTDINFQTYTYEAYAQNTGNISTTSSSLSEAKEKTEWHIYKGGIREIADLEFLDLVGDQAMYDKVNAQDDFRGKMQFIGNSSIALGIVAMLGGAALSASQPTIMGGALVTAAGFFISAFNQSRHHYIQADYAQSKIDDYNIALKRKLNIPLTYE